MVIRSRRTKLSISCSYSFWSLCICRIKKFEYKKYSFLKSNIYILICIVLSIIAYFISLDKFGELKTYYLPFGRFWEVGIGWITWRLAAHLKQKNLKIFPNINYLNRYSITFFILATVIFTAKKSFFLTFFIVILTSLFLLLKPTKVEYERITNKSTNIRNIRYFCLKHIN